jgi:hypothetical protein
LICAKVTIWDFEGNGPAGSTPICCIGLNAEVTAVAFQPDAPPRCRAARRAARAARRAAAHRGSASGRADT